jgi:hypothetical protein
MVSGIVADGCKHTPDARIRDGEPTLFYLKNLQGGVDPIQYSLRVRVGH